jgi:hypothetical protein
VERFGVEAESAPELLRKVLGRTRRLGRNPENGAIAALALLGGRVLVAILQDSSCVTVMTWNQFVPRLHEFGRTKVPRKWGRMLERLVSLDNDEPGARSDPAAPATSIVPPLQAGSATPAVAADDASLIPPGPPLPGSE